MGVSTEECLSEKVREGDTKSLIGEMANIDIVESSQIALDFESTKVPIRSIIDPNVLEFSRDSESAIRSWLRDLEQVILKAGYPAVREILIQPNFSGQKELVNKYLSQ